MSVNDLKINQIALDNKNRVWTVGQDVSVYDGSNWIYLNYLNSALPSNDPYYLDTRCISLDIDQTKWIGCANGPCVSDVAITTLSGQDNSESKSWTFTELGFTGGYYQCPTILASPYGSEVVAFVNDLNDGLGVTGATGYVGATGGTILIYNKITNEWNSPFPDGYYVPRVFTIKARGIKGANYEYWLGTSNGIWIIKSSVYDEQSLFSSQEYIPYIKTWTSENSGLPSNVVYSIDFDENGNAWIGTSGGLVFYDFEKWTSWNTSNLSGLPNNTITSVLARPNGHVFFTAGVGELKQGTGLHHFNGVSLTSFTSLSGDLPNNNVISLALILNNTSNQGLRNYINDLWVSCYNDLIQFSYTIPHVRATANPEGATGWNFVTYNSSSGINLPKADKYTWTYPSWSGEDFSYLLSKHPGMDPRLLFVDTNLNMIANGEAGNQDYWNAGPIPKFEDVELAKGLTGASWISTATGGTSYVKSVLAMEDLYVIGGYTNSSSINFGLKNSSDSLVLNNPNPTNSTGIKNNVGYLAYFNKAGQPLGSIPFRGNSTKVLDIAESKERDSIFVLGTFKGYMEAGQFVYNSTFPNAASLTTTGITGPTGGPIGFSTLNFPGITAAPFNYPWILNSATGGTASPYIPNASLASSDNEAMFILEIDKNLGSTISFGDINFGVTGDLERSYKLKNFRYFPAISTNYDPSGATGSYGYLNPDSLEMNVDNSRIDIVGGLSGGISTLWNQYGNTTDTPNEKDYLFSSFSSGYKSSGFWIELDTELNYYDSEISSGTGDTYFNGVSSDSSSNTILVTGSSNKNFTFEGTSSSNSDSVGQEPIFFVYEKGIGVSSNGIQFIKRGFYGEENRSVSGFLQNGKYTISSVVLPNPSLTINGQSFAVTGGTSYFATTFTPSGLTLANFSNPISGRYGFIEDAIPNDRGEFIFAISEYGSTGATGGLYLYKTSTSGTQQSVKNVSSTNTSLGEVSISSDPESNLLIGFSSLGATGESGFNFPSSTVYTGNAMLIDQYQPPVGINLGNIISRYGSGAWTWADVHLNGNNFDIPLLSTVFLTNYTSNIYGKNLNTWRIYNSKTEEKILDVRGVPYLIYTFVQPGYYSIQNTVEDANGNVYAITETAYITVKDHTIKKENDPDPFTVNSADYGYPPPSRGRKTFTEDLSKDLYQEQLYILSENTKNLKGSPLLLKNDPDATFDPIGD